jgi:fructose-1,6-bisphosphatase/inositol monophosphatase family enzyme
MSDLENYLEFAKGLAGEAGEIMKKYLSTEDALPEWKKANDPVTIADKTINDLVINRIKSSFKDHGILGEEKSHNQDREYLWVVDPLDGTIPYILGLPIATFLIALVVDGRPKVAVAYSPWIDLMFWAEEGKGAFRNGKKLRIHHPNTKIIEFIFWNSSPFKEQLTGVRELLEEAGLSPQNFAGGFSRYGVAENKLFGVIFSGDDPWDVAVLDLLVNEAGGKVTDLHGDTLDLRGPIQGAVAGSSETHAKLMGIIKNAHHWH